MMFHYLQNSIFKIQDEFPNTYQEYMHKRLDPSYNWWTETGADFWVLLCVLLVVVLVVVIFFVRMRNIAITWEIPDELLALAAELIKIDGTVSPSEIKRVEFRLQQNYSTFGAIKKKEKFKTYLKQKHEVKKLMKTLANYLFYTRAYDHFGDTQKDFQSRIRALNFLVSIACSDRMILVKEIEFLEKMSVEFELPPSVLGSLLARYNFVYERGAYKEKQTVKQYAPNSLTRYFKILELNENATEQEIKTAYRRLAKQYHPDVLRKQTPFNKEQFLKIKEAYEKIKDIKGF